MLVQMFPIQALTGLPANRGPSNLHQILKTTPPFSSASTEGPLAIESSSVSITFSVQGSL